MAFQGSVRGNALSLRPKSLQVQMLNPSEVWTLARRGQAASLPSQPCLSPRVCPGTQVWRDLMDWGPREHS